MSTGQSIINRALRLIGAIASGESPTAQESTDALEALNHLLDSWRLEKLIVYAFQTEALTLVPAQQSYTIGPSGDLNTLRPVRIEEAYMRVSGLDYPLTIVTAEQWAALPDKALGGEYPEWLWYEGTMPTGALKLYPVPTVAHSLNLVTWVSLTALTLGATVALPPGYERALVYSLAIEVAPEFGQKPPPAVVAIAGEALTAIKRANQREIQAYKDLYLLVEGGT